MRSRKGFTLIELLVVIAIIAILAAILFPVFMRAKQAAMQSHCQSNMTQIGKAVKMYLADWEDTYPTNRLLGAANLSNIVTLSDPAIVDPVTKEPIRYQYGVNWVEALYPYVEKVTEGDSAAVWKCPAASTSQVGGVRASVTYGFNSYLCESPEGAAKNAGNLMMIRELDRLHVAALKPRVSLSGLGTLPLTAFLNGKADQGVSKPKYEMHNGGSEILMADGHVKWFSVSFYPNGSGGIDCVWDDVQKQWFNYPGNNDQNSPKYHAIAVTP